MKPRDYCHLIALNVFVRCGEVDVSKEFLK